ncbi:nuclear transport factor 2 family protein [Nocardioides sp.]|uniref:nuclear transport factor 2 family protein n=1 Tax=Nocardioides sp. TaxID=35761 RepID=UPI0039E61D19
MSRHLLSDALGPVLPGPALDEEAVRQITALQMDYCASVDGADFARFAWLFRGGTWLGMPGSQVEDWLRRNLLTYDGATHTHHRLHTITLTRGSSADEVTGTCAIHVTQQLPGGPALLVTHNTYADRFRRVNGSWRFGSRAITRRLPGDDSWHRRRPPAGS